MKKRRNRQTDKQTNRKKKKKKFFWKKVSYRVNLSSRKLHQEIFQIEKN